MVNGNKKMAKVVQLYKHTAHHQSQVPQLCSQISSGNLIRLAKCITHGTSGSLLLWNGV